MLSREVNSILSGLTIDLGTDERSRTDHSGRGRTASTQMVLEARSSEHDVVSVVSSRSTAELTPSEGTRIRNLLDEAFEGRFTDALWRQALGGVHFFVEEDGVPISHASVVPRLLAVRDREINTGYVEAVGTLHRDRHKGLARSVLAAARRHIADSYELGALHSVLPTFYEHLGWERWRGPTFVRTSSGLMRTESDDGCIHIWRVAVTADLDLDVNDPISCEWRPGFVW
ncbi:MAG: GNAT family N-acetyltransferase [bacterium]|nr:GNAT family N-acetyltransferase [bacterium]